VDIGVVVGRTVPGVVGVVVGLSVALLYLELINLKTLLEQLQQLHDLLLVWVAFA